ncbi:MAG: N-acyl homoserine lactonase family protein [Thermoleophilia bacterium]|nr:N-acyl homoserine lactonase family protein [Thermoleophilia bacterium]
MARKKWTIAPLVLATAVRNISQALLMSPPGANMDTAVLGWLIRSDDDTVLVDTGFGSMDKEDLKGSFVRTPEHSLEAQLKRFDLAPEEVKLVVNTHLHIDHCGGNCFVPNARFVAQRSELEYALDPLPAHRPAYDVDLSSMNLDLLDGDAEITDGIRVIVTPGHSPGSQAVLVDTEGGLFVLAGDTIAHYLNMEVPKGDSFLPSPLYVDLREFYASLDRLRDLGGTILPGHDSLVLKKTVYP